MFSPTSLRLGLLLLAAASLHGFTVDSSISAVTVYADRAQISRTATVPLKQSGIQELEFTGLPASLNNQSLQVSGSGASPVTILDVAARLEHLASTNNTRVKELEDQLEALQLERRQHDQRGSLIKEQTNYLQLIRNATVYQQPEGQKRPDVEEWTRLMQFNAEQLTKLSTDSEQLQRDREALQEKIDLVNQQLGELRGARGRSVKRVIVRVEASAPGDFKVELGYTLTGASWAPAYDTRLKTTERVVALSYFGLVQNGTGEDWKNVALTLSTARPALGGGSPDLAPWVLDLYQAPAPAPTLADEGYGGSLSGKRVRGQPTAAATYFSNLAQEQVVALNPFSVSADKSVASVETGLSSATFKLPTPVSLPSDNTSQKVSLCSLELPAKLQYQATPKFSETAFLTAYVTNSSEYPLLAGPSNVFLDDSFIASSRLKSVMPGERFDLALGADESIAVKRRLVNRFSEKVGLTSKTTRVTYELAITLTNKRKTAEHVVFLEGLPVSRNEAIEVKLLTPADREVGTKESPKQVTREEDGKLVWRLDLQPAEKREISLKFQVDYPSSEEVTGLE